MSKKTLSPDEHLIYKTRFHKIKLFLPLLWIVVGFQPLCPSYNIFYIFCVYYFHTCHSIPSYFSYVVLIIWILPTVPSFLNYLTSKFTVTNKRVVIKVGWIEQKTLEFNINKVESISFVQGPFGRMFDFGDIVFTGPGGRKEIFQPVAYPLDFTNAVRKAQVEYEAQHK